MAIITQNTNTLPMQLLNLADSQPSPVVILPNLGIDVDFCKCDYTCEYINTVFASQTDSSDYKNDKNSFLIGLSADSSVLEIRLKSTTNTTDLVINNNDFGQYFAKGSITFTENQQNYVGFIVDWRKIQQILGNGIYYFEFKETIFARDFITESVKFRLVGFTDERSNKTVRIKFVQNGIIEGGLDYRGLNWETQIRIVGYLKYNVPRLEIDNYQTSKRVVTQIQDKTIENFTIETDLIPSTIGDQIAKNGVLANNILITNYDLFAYKKYVDFDVVVTENSDFKGNYTTNELGAFSFKCDERTQNYIKRNV